MQHCAPPFISAHPPLPVLAERPGRPPSRRARPARLDRHEPLLERFEPISLAEMDAVSLLSRVDAKCLLDGAQWCAVLATLADEYRVLEIAGRRRHRYASLYFDTAGLDLYASHQAGHAGRFKVRSRAYLDSGLCYLEVKRKTNKGRTVKERLQTPTFLTRLTPEADAFVRAVAPLEARALQPTLDSEFSRITLVSKRRPERVTFDLHLCYRPVTGCARQGNAGLPGLVVAEVKQENPEHDSGLFAALRALGLRPTAFSKYCIGMALLTPGVKCNRFKPVLRQVEHIVRGDGYAE